MIRKITIENFQSHKHTEVEFCPGVNVITGRSDSGKSSILRALQWVLWNRPTGFAFHSYFAKKEPTKVKVEFDDGSVIERIKSSRENKYIVNGVELKALGSQVPEEVLQTHKLEDFNLQTQFENYFLLQDSPGEVARKLNKVVGLDIIDELVKRANSYVNSFRSQISESDIRIEELQKEIEGYCYLDEIEPLLVQVDDYLHELEQLESELDELKQLVTDLEELERMLAEFVDIETLEEKLQQLESLECELQQVTEELTRLSGVVREIELVEQELLEFEEFGDFAELEEEMDEILSLVERIQKIEEKLEGLQGWVEDWLDVSALLNRADELLRDYVGEYLESIETAGVCPVCKSSITKDCIEEIKEELLS